MCGLAVGFAFPALALFLYHRYAGPVHLHIQNRNRLADDDGQIQLNGSADFALLDRRDISADCLRRTLYRFGGYFQTGQHLDLLAAVIEGRCLAHHRLHAPHSGRDVGILDVQFCVNGELAGVAVFAEIVGTRYLDRAHRGQNRSGAQFAVSRLAAARTSDGALFRGRLGELH
jgi:hypothetical protein